MAPPHIKNVSKAKRHEFRVVEGQHYIPDFTCLETNKLLLVGVKSNPVCIGCFWQCADMSQHLRKDSGCGPYRAIQKLVYCYEEHQSPDDEQVVTPHEAIISMMLNDTKCPVFFDDILAQPVKYNPVKDNFIDFNPKRQDGSDLKKHQVPEELKETTFHQLYLTYIQEKGLTEMEFPDLAHVAMDQSKSVGAFVKKYQSELGKQESKHVARAITKGTVHRMDDFEREVERRVKQRINQDIAAGKYQAVDQATQAGFQRAYESEVQKAVNSRVARALNEAVDKEISRRIDDGSLQKPSSIAN